jgi:hypothetical protein
MQTLNELPEDLDINVKIIQLLAKHGIKENIKIDDGAEKMVLSALENEFIEKVWVDEEGGLCIEYLDKEEDKMDDLPMINGSINGKESNE